MASQRAHIVLPQELILEIDALVGPRGRSAFLAETARAELRKRRLLEFLSDPEPAWTDEDHTELANGAYAWVRSLRHESEVRCKRSKKGTSVSVRLLLDTTVLVDSTPLVHTSMAQLLTPC